MSEELTIRREDDGGSKGRYVIALPDGDEAELTYSRANANLLIADHTGVPKAHGGKGIAGMLVRRLVEDARKEGVKIVPLCPYVKAWFERHPDWQDVQNGR
ncbi:MAG: N-acetyltransferase [Maricaulaceae bacterium]|nr:N-acetyltransferase [Maricaulaceae bacterium]